MRAFVFAGACLAGADIYREDGPAFRGRSQEFARRHPTEPEHAGARIRQNGVKSKGPVAQMTC